MEKLHFSDNLLILREKKNKSQEDIAKIIDVNRTTITNYESGTSAPNYEKLLVLAKYFDVSIDDLLLKDLSKDSAKGFPKAKKQHDGVPYVSVEALAGISNTDFRISKEDIIAYYIIPEFREADFFAPIKGESMGRDYPPGSVGAYKRIDLSKLIQWNKVYLVATKNDGLLLKRILPGKKENSWILKSDNPDFLPIEINIREVLGIAILLGIIREQ